MATPPRPHRKLTPRQALRAFYSPLHRVATRRQVLESFLAGAAVLSCSSSEDNANSLPAAASTPAAPASAGASTGQSDTSPSTTSSSNSSSPNGSASSSPASSASTQSAPSATPTSASTSAEPEEPTPPQPTQSAPETQTTASAPTSSNVEVMEPTPSATASNTPSTMGRSAYDLIELGNTGIVTSRLAMGSGTTGFDGSSVQTRMGESFTQLLIDGYDRGIRFFETADAYGSHSRVRDAMRQVGRANVTLLTKTMAETRADAEADLERFMEELGTDYLDIVLLHIRTSATWVADAEGAMEVLAEAKARGQIRAHGVSCHSLEALQLAAQTDWVDVDLARINPFQMHMDAEPNTVKGLLEGMKAAGKGVLGMKILGQGDAVDRFDEAIEHATRLDCIHGFTIGFRSLTELDQVATKMASV